MEIMFFQRQSKFSGGKIQQKWARLIPDNDVDCDNLSVIDEDVFLVVRDRESKDLKINDIPVLEQSSVNIVYSDENDAIKAIESMLVKEPTFKPEVILSADMSMFCRVLKGTEPKEFEPKFMVTEERNLLHYGMCGEDNTVLLVAYSTPDDICNN